MQTQEIPTHEWVPFLDEFSKRHAGELVTVELIGEDVGAQAEARAVPLVGVNVDLADGGRREQIEVIVGQEPRSHLMHAVPKPRRLQVARSDSGEDAALQIESESGPTVLLRLGNTARTPPQP